MEKPYTTSSITLHFEVSKDEHRDAVLLYMRPHAITGKVEDWDPDSMRERDELKEECGDRFGKDLRMEERSLTDPGYQLVLPVPQDSDIDRHYQQVAHMVEGFAKEHQFILDTGETPLDREGGQVQKLRAAREQNEAWHSLRNEVQESVESLHLDTEERTDAIMKSFEDFLKQRGKGGRG